MAEGKNGNSDREAELKKEIKKLKKRIRELEDELAGISAIHFIKRNGIKSELKPLEDQLNVLEKELKELKQ